ncbi:uncharacterized protein PITG_06284 [Phytophthora infestans T30-4]|uniref:Uncharacterized protein n=1 Tax=Phytophthora infestans (strain T30-4) TaxID=403677 RepID=D0N4I3_PHYIT|nr:uncharacterized protein PITG_06284 [Phytophthora infestans T30-4]EEY69791.1 conserved hypothetical protein [Phytophthora infestans T30-4]|eukprot:XP_002998438.1 conserved hypothetical protein [Phytophthora infestans T30-4]
MKERLAEILALRSVVDALQQEDLVQVLSEVTVLSDEYLPLLQFLMAPDNLTCLISTMLQEPTPTARATAAAARQPGDPPSYEKYATAFRAHWVLCGSGFSHQLLAAMTALKGEPRALIAQTLAELNSRDSMTLEAFARFIAAFMDQYSPLAFMALFDKNLRQQKTFLESLLLLVFYEPLRDVMVRMCNDLPGTSSEYEVETLVGISLLQLSPINPLQQINDRVSEKLHQRVAKDIETLQFSRMIFTCDLLTDLIHEKREGSLGFAMVTSLSESKSNAEQLIEAALRDLRQLPTSFANESHVLKVLNSLLQQNQCGCVTKAAFCRATAATHVGSKEGDDALTAACTEGSPHEDLPLVWQVFLSQLPTVLSFFSTETTSLQWRFNPTHVQLIYLMLPVLNVSCTVADTLIVRTKTLDTLLELITRFPEASIVHCAIARLFVVALEDSPFMFGKELPAFRSSTDPLRIHLLLGGALDFVLKSYGWTTVPDTTASEVKKPSPPPAFLDVAISLDQALTSAFAQSSQLFIGNSAFERWKVFRLEVLLPIQTLWEEQYQPPPAAETGPSPMLAAMLYGEGHDQPLEDIPTDTKHLRERKQSTDGIAPPTNSAKAEGPCVSVMQPTSSAATSAPVLQDVPTPLSALYNEEEKHMMLNVRDDDAVSSPPLALVIPAAVPQTI